MAGSRRSPRPSRIEQSRLRQQAASDGAPRTLTAAAAVADVIPAAPRAWPFHAAVSIAAVTVAVSAYLTGPAATIGQPRLWMRVGGAVLAAGLGRYAQVVHGRGGVQRRAARRTLVASVTLLTLFIVGIGSSVTIDGHVSLAGSQQARSVELLQQVKADLDIIASYDELLALDTAAARVEVDRYPDAVNALTALAGSYAQIQVAHLPSAQFVPALRQVATAADFGARALAGKRDLTLQHDARLEQTVMSYRETYVTAVLTAGPLLADLGQLIGYPLVDPTRDAVE
jgi:hypothetical protein